MERPLGTNTSSSNTDTSTCTEGESPLSTKLGGSMVMSSKVLPWPASDTPTWAPVAETRVTLNIVTADAVLPGAGSWTVPSSEAGAPSTTNRSWAGEGDAEGVLVADGTALAVGETV